MSAKPPRRRRRVIKWIVVLLIVFAFYSTRNRTLPAWGRWLNASEPPRRADYALVLTGGENTRPYVAAGLYKHGWVDAVLVPRLRITPDAADGITLPESELIRRILIQRGVPQGKVIFLPGEINSTADEANALKLFLDEHPNATVAIVTNDFHTRRARTIFRNALGPRADQIYMVAAPTDNVAADNWWHTKMGFSLYISETFKSAYYSIR